MAFEDRCSPNQATTPGPDPNRTSSPESPNPNDRNLKPYTCTTMSSKYERSKTSNFPQIQNIYLKPQTVSPLEMVQFNPLINAFHSSPIMYNPYYNPYIINSLPLHPDYLRQIHQNGLPHQEEDRKNKSMIARPDEIDRRNQIERQEPLTDDQDDLHFSISNILKPEFGINAIRKTTNKKEGPKHGGPVHSILYKPYELAKNQIEPKTVQNTNSFNNLEDIGPLDNRGASFQESPFKTAPLGSLSNTVSQIGTKNFASKASVASTNGTRSDGAAKTGCNGFAGSKEDFSSIRRPDSANSSISTSSSNVSSQQGLATGSDDAKSGDTGSQQWPAWVYCTRYSDRPSSGPRSRRSKKPKPPPAAVPVPVAEDKRPRTAFSSSQLARLKHEFAENRYLNERRRQQLSAELGLNEAQIKIWFQNKRAKIKKASGQKNPLALQLMAQGLYNHGTASCSEGEEEDHLIQVA